MHQNRELFWNVFVSKINVINRMESVREYNVPLRKLSEFYEFRDALN